MEPDLYILKTSPGPYMDPQVGWTYVARRINSKTAYIRATHTADGRPISMRIDLEVPREQFDTYWVPDKRQERGR